MTFKIAGTEVGLYSTAESHTDFYGYDVDANPSATGFTSAGVYDVDPSGLNAYYVGHEDTTTGTIAFGYSYVNPSGSDELGNADTTLVDIANRIESETYIFDLGNGVDIGSPGEHSFVFADGEPVNDDGDSTVTFEAGTGLSYANVFTVAEDEPTDFTGGTGNSGDDKYNLVGADAVSNHRWGYADGDGAMWQLTRGAYSFTVRTGPVSDGRGAESDIPPQRYYGVGPSNSVTISTSEYPSFTVEIDV